MTRSTIGLLSGPLLFLIILAFPLPQGIDPAAMKVAALTVLMAVWWVTEAIPIPATSLLPILMFPVLGIMDTGKVTQAYGNHLIFLFMGGFFIAVTVEKWNLHRRIALYTIRLIGVTPDRMILGFMIATAFLSMWINNTSTTMMMLTIALAVLHQVTDRIDAKAGNTIDTRRGHFNFGKALVLGIAYAASIGGVATLIGTAPNAIFAGVVEQTFGQSISFTDWMLVAFPLSVAMLITTWFYLVRIAYPCEMDQLPGGSHLITQEIRELGPMTAPEFRVMLVFITVAVAWITRGLIDIRETSFIKDSTIAIGGALLLFLIPAHDFKQREFLLDWKTAVTIPWDILILFGGGFALAQGFTESGLTHVIAEQLGQLQGSHIILIILAVTTVVIFLTEVTSNTAIATIMMPIMAALAGPMQVHPYGLMMAAVMAASCAFMLPVATPPNAIVFGTRYVTIPQMAKTGIWLNLIGIILISMTVLILLPAIWNIELAEFPDRMVK